MRIQITQFYQNVNGVKLPPGIHDVQPTLGQYLIDTEQAVAVVTDGRDNTDTIAEALMTGQLEVEDSSVNVDGFDRDYYLELYEDIYEKSAPSNISDDTLRQRVENPPSDDTSDLHD